jgi:hypothetical protein
MILDCWLQDSIDRYEDERIERAERAWQKQLRDEEEDVDS